MDNSRTVLGVENVLDCARRAGFIPVDSYGELRRRYETDVASFWKLWVRETYDTKYNTGHMSAEGNRVTAEILANAIRREMLREGQTFFVHNRVDTIGRVAARLREHRVSWWSFFRTEREAIEAVMRE